MKLFFEELARIEKKHADFFANNKIGIFEYIKTYKSPAMVELNKTVLRHYPLPAEIKAKIDALISNPRPLRGFKQTK
jgi:hypothetical protein